MKQHWELVDWHGNPDLGHKCYKRKVGTGFVYVGVGDFLLVVHSFGANSYRSHSSTRWRETGVISEQEAMDLVDKQYGI